MRHYFALFIILHAATALTRAPLHAAFFPDNPFTDKARGTTGAAFLKLAPSARCSALGESISIAVSDPASSFYTPAIAAHIPNGFLALSSGLLVEDILQAGAIFALPAASGKILIGSQQIIEPAIKLYDKFGSNIGEFSPLDYTIHAGYASINAAIPSSFHLNYIETRVGPSLTGKGVALGFGFGFPYGFFIDPNTSITFAVSNLGPALKIGDKSFPLPLRSQIQFGYKLAPSFFANADLAFPVDQAPFAIGSLEWKFPLGTGGPMSAIETASGLAIRVGITSKNKTKDFTDKLSYGLGLHLGNLLFDASAAPFGNLGLFPRLGLSLLF